MVEVSFLGHSGVRIRGKKVSLVIDPPAGDILGNKISKKVAADIVMLTQSQVAAHSNLELVQPAAGQLFKIEGPGEYEIQTTEILGLPAISQGSCLPAGEAGLSDSTKLTIYQILLDGISLVFLGTISKLSQNLVEQLSAVDVLFLPVGGKVSIELKEAVNVITTLEPAIVVPIHYSQGEKAIPARLDSAKRASRQDGLGTIDQFLAQVGKIPKDEAEKLQVTRDKLPEEVKIVVLKNAQ